MAYNDSCCFDEANQVRKFNIAILTWRMCTPVIIALGTVGNIVSLVVLQQAKMRRNVLAKHLTALAASNLMVLYFTMLVKYFLYVNDVNILDNIVACKMIYWLSEPLGQFNSWLMVAITTERFIAVMKPLQMRAAGRVIHAKKQIFFIAALFLVLNSHVLYGYGHKYKNKPNANETILVFKCGLVNSTYKQFYSYWVVVEIILMFYLPELFLFIGNIGIILMLKKRFPNRILFMVGKSTPSDRIGLRARQSLALVLLLNTGFILFTAPISIVFFVYKPWDRQNRHISTYAFTVTYAVVNMIMYTKYSIGFLFFMVISDFRSEICRLLRLRKGGCFLNQRTSVYSIEHVSIDANVG